MKLVNRGSSFDEDFIKFSRGWCIVLDKMGHHIHINLFSLKEGFVEAVF